MHGGLGADTKVEPGKILAAVDDQRRRVLGLARSAEELGYLPQMFTFGRAVHVTSGHGGHSGRPLGNTGRG